MYDGEETAFSCARAEDGTIGRYAVSAASLSGEGERSPFEATDDPEALNYKPDIERPFNRHSLYGHHPFLLQNAHRYRELPSEYPGSASRI